MIRITQENIEQVGLTAQPCLKCRCVPELRAQMKQDIQYWQLSCATAGCRADLYGIYTLGDPDLRLAIVEWNERFGGDKPKSWADSLARDFPEVLTSLNVKSYLYECFHVCGCSDFRAMIGEICKLLVFHDHAEKPADLYERLYPGSTVGVFYLLAGQLDHLGLTEHGSAMRQAWLTEEGVKLLRFFSTHSAEQVEQASGQCYRGLDWQADA